jgi:hypothetical protein
MWVRGVGWVRQAVIYGLRKWTRNAFFFRFQDSRKKHPGDDQSLTRQDKTKIQSVIRR